MRTVFYTIIAVLILSTMNAVSYAQLIVTGKGLQQSCYEAALYGNRGTQSAIASCTEGLKRTLSRKDEAATYVNRGILFMRKAKFEQARKDYEAAIKIAPTLAEAYMNYGAVLIHLNDYDGALKALNTAIEDLNPKELHQALYNRAIVYHAQEKYRDAYRDLKHALELRPDWEDALKSLERYTVVTKNSG